LLRTDVAIIGAGAAGITLARELAATRIDTLVIESGGFERDEAQQSLSRGESVGTPYWPLDGNRQRSVGGSTNLWAGWCRPLDDLDFGTRDWIPLSGWPLDRDSLTPYYARAQEVCELGPPDYDLTTWERRLGARRLPLRDGDVVSRMFHLSPPTRFGAVHVPALTDADNVTILSRATVLEIVAAPNGRSVSELLVGALDGRRFRVEPRSVVLATGGVENARLLLLSDRHSPQGLGNDHDQVGRYFMEHLHFVHGAAVLEGVSGDLRRLYTRRADSKAVARLFLTPRAQEREACVQGNVMLSPRRTKGPRAARAARRGMNRLRRVSRVEFAHTLEQPPDPSNRVTLGDDADAFGQRRVRLEWRVSEMEERTFRTNLGAVSHALERAGLGRVEIPEEHEGNVWPPAELQGMRGHHMGTTRMSIDPKLGVVDADCRVHGIGNLYVAGSSVFPTGGAGTPTLTIVALAIRLADHLRSNTRTREG
jgi:choline dehydrogenase-like flavoprotein